jgi:hypothetical protein
VAGSAVVRSAAVPSAATSDAFSRITHRSFGRMDNFLFDILQYISPNQYDFLESYVFFSDSFNYLLFIPLESTLAVVSSKEIFSGPNHRFVY